MKKLLACLFLPSVVLASFAACSSDGAPALTETDAADAETPDAEVDAGDLPDVTETPETSVPDASNVDAGSSNIDLDNLEDGEFVVKIDDCGSFDTCGGDIPAASYTYSGACFRRAELEASIRNNPQLNCPNFVVTDTVMVAKGDIAFAAEGGATTNHLIRSGQARFYTRAEVPAACLGQYSCSLVGLFGSQVLPGLNCVDDGAGGCVCAANATIPLVADADFTVAEPSTGKEIVTQVEGAAAYYPFCVGDNSFGHIRRPQGTGQVPLEAYLSFEADLDVPEP